MGRARDLRAPTSPSRVSRIAKVRVWDRVACIKIAFCTQHLIMDPADKGHKAHTRD